MSDGGRVLVTRPIPEVGLEMLRRRAAHVRVLAEEPDELPSAEAITRAAADADVVLALLTDPIGADLLDASRHLRGVANYAVGFDNVDVTAATALGIPVSNTPDVLTESTADFTWALLLGVARRLVEADRLMRSGRFRAWGAEFLLGRDVSPGGDGVPKTLGVIGFGRIGRAVAARANGFALRVLVHSPGRDKEIAAAGHEAVDLKTLLAESDFVTPHTPLRDSTHHLIDGAALARMKPTAYLINTSRGPVVDEDALVAALRARSIAGAALDVFENEPRMAEGLAELDNVLIAPHVASATRGTRDEMARLAATNAVAMLAGRRAPNCVNPSVYSDTTWSRKSV